MAPPLTWRRRRTPWPYGARLHAAIRARYRTVSEFAAACGMGQPRVSHYVHGKATPTAESLDRMLATLGITRAQLLATEPLPPGGRGRPPGIRPPG